MRALLCVLALMAASGAAFADVDTTLTAGDAQIDPILTGGIYTFQFTGLDPNALTGAALTFQARGDLNTSSTVTGTGSIPLAALLPRIADGKLNVSFDYGPGVDNFGSDFASVRIRYRTGPGGVPEPASLALLGTGVAAIAWRIRRRRRA